MNNMITERLKTDPENYGNSVLRAAELLKNGGTVAIPTETVYGLAASAYDENAVKRVFEAKGRPQDNPLIVHIADLNTLSEIARDIPDSAYKCAELFWPGPLTIILKRTDKIPACVSAGLDTVAVRMPSDKTARDIISASVPLAAPSANTSGRPSPTSAECVIGDLDGKIDAVVMGKDCTVGVESTVITLVTNPPKILRPGAVTPEQLKAVIPDIQLDKAVLSMPAEGEKVSSPGMKYKHYAPSAEVYIISGSSEAAARYIRRRFGPGDAVLCFAEELPLYDGCNPTAYGSENDVRTLSAGLFAALRDLDRPDIRTIYARCPEGGGVAYAVGNRLKKAAAFRVVDAEREA